MPLKYIAPPAGVVIPRQKQEKTLWISTVISLLMERTLITLVEVGIGNNLADVKGVALT